jgi:DNA polymerase/3'-5' exonuclease PolX
MADDIVTRLREAANYVETDGNTWAADDCRDAADEIERLRAELKRWEVCEIVFDSLCGWDTEETFCDKCKAVQNGL